jgi:hypothetical protein
MTRPQCMRSCAVRRVGRCNAMCYSPGSNCWSCAQRSVQVRTHTTRRRRPCALGWVFLLSFCCLLRCRIQLDQPRRPAWDRSWLDLHASAPVVRTSDVAESTHANAAQRRHVRSRYCSRAKWQLGLRGAPSHWRLRKPAVSARQGPELGSRHQLCLSSRPLGWNAGMLSL